LHQFEIGCVGQSLAFTDFLFDAKQGTQLWILIS